MLTNSLGMVFECEFATIVARQLAQKLLTYKLLKCYLGLTFMINFTTLY